jgi:hypothetical protein
LFAAYERNPHANFPFQEASATPGIEVGFRESGCGDAASIEDGRDEQGFEDLHDGLRTASRLIIRY